MEETRLFSLWSRPVSIYPLLVFRNDFTLTTEGIAAGELEEWGNSLRIRGSGLLIRLS